MDVLYVYCFKSVGSYKHKLSSIESLVILYWGINCTYTESELMERKISPFGKMSIQLADMISNTGISLHCLEKEFTFSETLDPVKDSQSTGKTSDHPNQELKIKKLSLEK